MKTITKKIAYWSGVITIGLIIGVSLQIATAWVAPPATPPNANVGAPINTSAIGQTKQGNLFISGLDSLNVPYLNGLIVANGRVGIGTSSPGGKLDVSGDIIASQSSIVIDRPNTTGGWARGINFYPTDTYSGGHYGGIGMYGSNTTVNSMYMAIGNDPWGNNNGIHLLSNGNVGIGTTSPGYKFTVNGDISATSFIYSSDISKKENIFVISSALNKVKMLQGVEFNWKENGKKDIGLIAQEVEKVIPEIVHTDNEGIKGLEYANLTALLIEAVKEQQQEIEQLKLQIDKNN